MFLYHIKSVCVYPLYTCGFLAFSNIFWSFIYQKNIYTIQTEPLATTNLVFSYPIKLLTPIKDKWQTCQDLLFNCDNMHLAWISILKHKTLIAWRQLGRQWLRWSHNKEGQIRTTNTIILLHALTNWQIQLVASGSYIYTGRCNRVKLSINDFLSSQLLFFILQMKYYIRYWMVIIP